MHTRSEIKSEKILVKDIFSRMWFRIPEYQRPYVWGHDEVADLLGDFTFAMKEKSDSEYFFGSLVFQSKSAEPKKGQEFDENDLLDGQQRMTTLLLLFAVIRDMSEDPEAKEDCQRCIYQKASKYKKIPERMRLIFPTREAVWKFIDNYIKVKDGTNCEDDLAKTVQMENDISVQNMAKAVLQIRKFFRSATDLGTEELLQFLLNQVLLIYVSTEDLEDAFRLFMILNDRGIPLRNSDILKSINLGALEDKTEKVKYAKLWEEAEGELGDDFDRFLNHVRTILIKEKARLSLLREFEDKIYDPKDKSTGKRKPALLQKGKNTFDLIDKYLTHFKALLGGVNYDDTGNFEFDNLIKVMLTGLPATDWVPPLLRYFDRFRYNQLLEFLKKLDVKFSGDWVSQYSPTYRIEAMNNIIKTIDVANKVEDVLSSKYFDIDEDPFLRVLSGPVYRKRFARYLLLKLDYFYKNHDQKMHFETLSVEHILPQNPADNSQWVKDFTSEDREEWTHKLGNLVLITRRKNTSLGRLDYSIKVKKYFEKSIDTCPNSLRVMNKYQQWTPTYLKENHELVLSEIRAHYGISD